MLEDLCKITNTLLEFGKTIDPKDQFPVVIPESVEWWQSHIQSVMESPQETLKRCPILLDHYTYTTSEIQVNTPMPLKII